MLAPRSSPPSLVVPVPPALFRPDAADLLRRLLCLGLGLILTLEAPAALAQSTVRTTTWSALKRSATDPAPMVDPGMTPAEVRAALQAVSRLRPKVVPRVIHGVTLGTGTVYSVSGPAGTGLFVTHVVTADGRRVGSTVFDYARGVIRSPSGDRIAWTAPSGNLEKDLRRIYELQGTGDVMRSALNSACNMLVTGPATFRCLAALIASPGGFLACLGLMLAITVLCYLMSHVAIPPDPDQEVGQTSPPLPHTL